MVETVDYAKLSLSVYSDSEIPEGWVNLDVQLPLGSNSSGFFARAFQNASGEIVIAYRGTDQLRDLFLTDASIALQTSNAQFVQALEFAQAVKLQFGDQASSISVAGHSLRLLQTLTAEFLESGVEGYRGESRGLLDAVKDLFTRNQPLTQKAAEQLVANLETLKSQPQIAQNTAILADLVSAQDKVKQSVQDILSVDLSNNQWSEADGANILDITINLQYTLAQESQVIRVDLPDAAFDKFADSLRGYITTGQSMVL